MKEKLVQIVLLLVVLSYFPFLAFSKAEDHPTTAVMESWNNDDYAEQLVPEGCSRVICPLPDDSWFTDDDDTLQLMKALRNWYYTDTKREKLFIEGKYVLIVNPYIFKVDRTQQHKRVYCMCGFDEYWLYSDREMKNHLCLGWNMYQAFTVDFIACKDNWTVNSISSPQKDEELVPGWGIGTQGMNGISDDMIEIMYENNYTGGTEEYARTYIIQTCLSDTQIVFE